MTVGKNDHAAWWIELEPEAAGSRDMEIASKSLIVGARLQERSFEIGNLVEIGAYPPNKVNLLLAKRLSGARGACARRC
jgi:hypothetical protein